MIKLNAVYIPKKILADFADNADDLIILICSISQICEKTLKRLLLFKDSLNQKGSILLQKQPEFQLKS